MDVEALQQTISAMRTDAYHPQGWPMAVCATSGTTVMGAFDDLPAIAAVCEAHACWLHVDASWGGAVMFAPEAPRYMRGVENADSVSFNPHKLLNVTHQCSFLLVKDQRVLYAPPADAGYLFHADGKHMDLAAKTLGCGRRGEALKLYLSWLRYGTHGFGQRISAGLALAQRVRAYIQTQPTLELGPQAEPLFLQICFRPRQAGNAGTRALHAAFVRERTFAVDFAPIHGEEYLRLVVHPSTEYEAYETLVRAAAAAAAAAATAATTQQRNETT